MDDDGRYQIVMSNILLNEFKRTRFIFKAQYHNIKVLAVNTKLCKRLDIS